jgi:hypothetical protein
LVSDVRSLEFVGMTSENRGVSSNHSAGMVISENVYMHVSIHVMFCLQLPVNLSNLVSLGNLLLIQSIPATSDTVYPWTVPRQSFLR